jgi:F0F1-type ATP synthase assembly protein I
MKDSTVTKSVGFEHRTCYSRARMQAASPSQLNPAGAGGLLLAVLVAAIGVGLLLGWAVGSPAIGALVGAVVGVLAGIFAVYRRYRGAF